MRNKPQDRLKAWWLYAVTCLTWNMYIAAFRSAITERALQLTLRCVRIRVYQLVFNLYMC